MIVSYFEWLQNLSNEYWNLTTVEDKLENLLSDVMPDLPSFKLRNLLDDFGDARQNELIQAKFLWIIYLKILIGGKKGLLANQNTKDNVDHVGHLLQQLFTNHSMF